MKFIHTGDLHLDSPFRGLSATLPQLWQQIHQSTFTAFQRIIDAALKEQVDFVLIVGDIYDRDHHSAEAEDFFARQCQRLAKAQIPVYLSYGNHDYQQVRSAPIILPDNVHVFANEVETKQLQTKDNQLVAITGFSYDQRWLPQDQVIAYPAADRQVDWHLGMLHGSLQTNDDQQDHYAPFTIDELLKLHYDYWALGHIHKHQVLNEQPPIVYCGNPQGRHQNENGQHGYYLVQTDGQRLVPTFHSIAPIEWVNQVVKLQQATTSQEAVAAVLKQLADQFNEHQLMMVNLVVDNERLNPRLIRLINSGALLGQLQTAVEEHDCRWWPFKISQRSQQQLPTMTDLDIDYWRQAADQVFTETELQQLITDKLLQNTYLADQLEQAGLLAELKQRATNLLQDGGDDNEN